MKLLLRETVDQLGTIGDVVNVPDGYGRNYLLPRGIALAVTPENVRRLDVKKKDLLAVEARKRDEAQALAEKVKAKQITITAKAAGEEGKLYGSVTGLQIAEQFQKEGLPIEARMILLDQPIKELGVFDVRLRIFPQVEVEAKVWIVEESTAGQAVAAAPSSAEKAEAARPGREGKGRRAEAAKAPPPEPKSIMTEKQAAAPQAGVALSPIDEQEALVPVGKKKQKRAQKEAASAADAEETSEDEAGKGKKGGKKK